MSTVVPLDKIRGEEPVQAGGKAVASTPILSTNLTLYRELLGTLGIENIDFGENLAENGNITHVTDEAFAEAKNLLDPADPTFDFGNFDAKRGQKFSSWETRRHSSSGKEEAEIELGKPGRISTVIIDTKWHDGNHAQAAELLASNDRKNWTRLIAPVELRGHSAHILRVDNTEVWGHVKLVMFPDGGIARLRLYEDVPTELASRLLPHNQENPTAEQTMITVRHQETISKSEKDGFIYPDAESIAQRRAETNWEQSVLLTNMTLGARIVGASNQRYSHAGNVLKEGPSENMGDGWENARFRLPMNDILPDERGDNGYERIWDHAEWIVIELADRGTIDDIKVDFKFFNFNNPEFMQIEGCDLPPGSSMDELDKSRWNIITPKTRVKAYASQEDITLPGASKTPVNYLRVKIFPCGGVHRIRATGKKVA